MPKIVSVEEMRSIEKAADASGLTYALMMENAGRSVADAILERFPANQDRRLAILVGPGNNGGDGLVAGHYLVEAGFQVACYLVKARKEDDPNLDRIKKENVLVALAEDDQRNRVLQNMMRSADIVVDAVFGTGFKLPLKDPARSVLNAARNALARREKDAYVVALDCPSGLDCNTGEVAQEALAADLTVTLAAAKPGLFRFPGADLVGQIEVGDIGLPPDQKELGKVKLEMADPETMSEWLPPRPRDAHKGTFGRAVIVAGSANFPGAAALAGLGAYRVGAGLVTLAVPTSIQPIVGPQIPEATWILLPHELGAIAEGAAEVLMENLGSTEALLLGPGFGQEPTTGSFLGRVFRAEGVAPRGHIGFLREGERSGESEALPVCVVDADGLKLLRKIPGWPDHLPEGSILTPHPGEMSVLTGEDTAEIQSDRVGSALKWSAEWGHTVVLKGAFTIVASPDGRATLVPIASPALARAGTGDVLAGMIVGLCAQGVDSHKAAVLGAYLHGRAGVLAAEAVGFDASVLAGDVAAAIPEAMSEIVS